MRSMQEEEKNVERYGRRGKDEEQEGGQRNKDTGGMEGRKKRGSGVGLEVKERKRMEGKVQWDAT